MDLLRFSTAGSVDDGKSTLIGRLLFDSKGVFEDQLEAVQRSTVNRASVGIDLSLLTDGLRAEREQGITIDVAYRYFATPKRKFIIADTPGHEQYTRNMATGSSTANLSIVLIDARYGALVQSRRHTFIASMLAIPHLVVAVNKMDLVDWSEARFDEIRRDFGPFCAKLGFPEVTFIPMSALIGDNVVERSAHMPWYTGPTLLDHLETVDITADENLDAFRFPVQLVIRPNLDYRGFAGQIASGVVRKGDEVIALPAGTRSRIRKIDTYDGELDVAAAPLSVTLLLEDEIDISRGDMLVHTERLPWVVRDIDARMVWMDAAPLDLQRPYLLKHTTRTVRVRIAQLHHRVDVNTLAQVPADTLQLNEIARVGLSAAQPLYVDPYSRNRRTGSFILIDPLTNATVAAGMVVADQPQQDQSLDALRRIDRAAREAQAGHKATVLWLTGRLAAERGNLARALETRMFHRGVHALVLDGDTSRALNQGAATALPNQPGAERDDEAVRRVAEVARLLLRAGQVVIVDIDTPRRSQRELARRILGAEDFAEVLVVAGGDDPAGSFESPVLADATVLLQAVGTNQAVAHLMQWLHDRGVFGAPRVVGPGAGI